MAAIFYFLNKKKNNSWSSAFKLESWPLTQVFKRIKISKFLNGCPLTFSGVLIKFSYVFSFCPTLTRNLALYNVRKSKLLTKRSCLETKPFKCNFPASDVFGRRTPTYMFHASPCMFLKGKSDDYSCQFRTQDIKPNFELFLKLFKFLSPHHANPRDNIAGWERFLSLKKKKKTKPKLSCYLEVIIILIDSQCTKIINNPFPTVNLKKKKKLLFLQNQKI